MKPARETKKEVIAAFRTREILAAARGLMGQKSLEAVTMDEIAQAAGVAKGTLYLYFPSKDGLIQALLSQTGENLLRDIEAILTTNLTAPDKLKQVLSVLLINLERERALFPSYWRELPWGERGAPKGKVPHFQEIEEKIVTRLTGLFAQGIAEGHFLPFEPRLLTYFLRGLIQATGYYQMTEDRLNISQEALPVLSTLIFSGLSPRSDVFSEVAQT